MTRGTRRLAWLAAVFALASVPIACSGFSSEETQTPAVDGGDASSTVDDANSGPDSAGADAGAMADAHDASPADPCANAPLFCATFEDENAGVWPKPFVQLYPADSSVQRVFGASQGFESMGAMWSPPIADARRSAVELQKGNVPTRVSFRFRAETLGTEYEIFLANLAAISVRVFAHGDGAIGFWVGGTLKFKSAANILQAGVWSSVIVDLRLDTGRATLISPASAEHQFANEKGGSIGYLFGPATGSSGAPSVYYDNVRLDLLP